MPTVGFNVEKFKSKPAAAAALLLLLLLLHLHPVPPVMFTINEIFAHFLFHFYACLIFTQNKNYKYFIKIGTGIIVTSFVEPDSYNFSQF